MATSVAVGMLCWPQSIGCSSVCLCCPAGACACACACVAQMKKWTEEGLAGTRKGSAPLTEAERRAKLRANLLQFGAGPAGRRGKRDDKLTRIELQGALRLHAPDLEMWEADAMLDSLEAAVLQGEAKDPAGAAPRIPVDWVVEFMCSDDDSQFVFGQPPALAAHPTPARVPAPSLPVPPRATLPSHPRVPPTKTAVRRLQAGAPAAPGGTSRMPRLDGRPTASAGSGTNPWGDGTPTGRAAGAGVGAGAAVPAGDAMDVLGDLGALLGEDDELRAQMREYF